MAKGVSIGIGVDASDALDGIESTEDALNKVAHTLDDLGKDGSKDIEKVEKSLTELDRESVRTGESMKKNVGRKTRDATDDAKAGMDDLKQESAQTAKETAQSFDGSTESIVGMFQEISAQAFAGFGPAGAAAGVAAAVGIGAVSAVITKIEEDAKASKARIGELASEMIDAGGVGQVSLNYVSEELKKILTNGGEGAKSLDEVKKAAKTAGVSVGTVAMAYSGNEKALDGLIDKVDKATKEQLALVDAQKSQGEGRVSKETADQATALGNLQKELIKTRDETNLAKQAEQEWLTSGGAEIIAKQDAIAGLNSYYDDAVNNVTEFVNKETGVLDVTKYLESIEARKKALADYQTSLATSGFTTEQKSALNAMGVEQAAAFMKGYESATPAQKKAMAASLTDAASESSGVAKGIIDKTFEKPITPTIAPFVDAKTMEANKAAIQKALTNQTFKINIRAYDKNGKPVD